MKKILFGLFILFYILILPIQTKASDLGFTDEVIRKSRECLGDVCNELKMIDGEYYLVEYIGVSDLSGFNWTHSQTNTYTSAFFTQASNFPNIIYPTSDNIIPNIALTINDYVYQIVTYNQSVGGNDAITATVSVSSRNRLYIRVLKDDIDRTNPKPYFDNSDIIFKYAMSTPITTKINSKYNDVAQVNFLNPLEFDIGKVLRSLYNSMQSLSLMVSYLWNWLSTGVYWEFKIPFIGVVLGLDLSPLGIISGAGLIALITLWLIKSLAPLA